MNNRMSKRPVLVNAVGATQKLERISLSNGSFQENWIQELLEKEPAVLPTAEIDPIFAPLICVAREVHMGVDENKGGRIDNLYISPKGYVVVVETKLWRNPEARREVVGQILDYAKEVRTWDYEKLDAIYKNYHKDGKSLFAALVSAGYKTPDEEAGFIDVVQKNIRAARFLLMIVGDGIREGVEKLADYMNKSPDMQHRIALCELEVYEMAGGSRLVVPQLTLKTNIIERGIIRVEGGEIKIDVSDNQEEKTVACRGNSYASAYASLSQEEFISEFMRSHTGISEDTISTFLEDVADLGFQVSFTSRSASISLYLQSLHANIALFQVVGKPKADHEADIWFVPARIYKRLRTLGYSEEIVKSLLNDWRPFLKGEYGDNAKFHFLNDTIISTQRTEFLDSLERFRNNF